MPKQSDKKNIGEKIFSISPEGIGAIGMVINFIVALTVSRFTSPPPIDVQNLVEEIRIPRDAHSAHEINA